MDVAKFYDEFSDQYTESVRRCNPCYDEMLASAFDYLPEDWQPTAILELGCGTGNLTLLLQARYSQARLTAVDISAEALKECRLRVPSELVSIIEADMSDLSFESGSFSLVISSLAIHHLIDEKKRGLYANTFDWLSPGGFFVICDRFKEDGDYLREVNRRIWKERARARGATIEELERWSQHEIEHDNPGKLTDQVKMLKDAGFATADCVWRRWIWATLHAQKA